MQNEKCYFSILYTLYKCTSYILLLSQQVLIRFIKPWFSLQLCRAIRLLWENKTTNQMFGYTHQPTRNLTHTHTHTNAQLWAHIVTLAHPHTHTHTSVPLHHKEQSNISKLTVVVICCWRIRV